MLRTFLRNFPIRASSTAASSGGAEKWDLYTAVCLERGPKTIPQMTELEKKFSEHLAQIELEKSYKSEHEVRLENEMKQLAQGKHKDMDMDVVVQQTAQEFIDVSLDELNKFKFASSTTEAENNLKSTNRKLEKHLVFVLEQTVGDKNFFLPPQTMRKEGETLRQTAERILKDSVGENVKAQIYGNAPTGFYKYKYPKTMRDSGETPVGAKVFIYFARYKGGDLPETKNFKWLDRTEMSKELPPRYNHSLKQFLIDE